MNENNVPAAYWLTDAEYVLGIIDETFARVPQIKAHHDRLRSIASKLAAAPVAQPPATGEALRDVIERTAQTIERQLELIGEHAPGNFLDKRPVVQSLSAHVKRLRAALATPPAPTTALPPVARVPLSEAQIERGRRETFSTDNPFCPCDSKTMRKAVRWAERAHRIGIEASTGEQS